MWMFIALAIYVGCLVWAWALFTAAKREDRERERALEEWIQEQGRNRR